jgi:rhodanese-related sulfurtransferase
MKKLLTVAAVLCFSLFLVGSALTLGSPAVAAPTKEKATALKKIHDKISILPEDALNLFETKKELLVIDVRSPFEFEQGAIENSRNIPFIDILEGRHALPKDAPILLVCSIGGRSFAAGQILLERKYQEVYSLDGGLDSWKEEGLPIKP